MLNGVIEFRLGADADRGAERLARQHVRAVEFAGDHAVEHHLPVGLRLERDVQAFLLEEALLVGDGERRHVGELDEAELQLLLLHHQRRRARRTDRAPERERGAGHRRGLQQMPAGQSCCACGARDGGHGSLLIARLFPALVVPGGRNETPLIEAHESASDQRRCCMVLRWTRERAIAGELSHSPYIHAPCQLGRRGIFVTPQLLMKARLREGGITCSKSSRLFCALHKD